MACSHDDPPSSKISAWVIRSSSGKKLSYSAVSERYRNGTKRSSGLTRAKVSAFSQAWVIDDDEKKI